ncbi:MAG: carboxypeptidase-like regulatory domain-containing protein [Planctomycetota bacterium]
MTLPRRQTLRTILLIGALFVTGLLGWRGARFGSDSERMGLTPEQSVAQGTAEGPGSVTLQGPVDASRQVAPVRPVEVARDSNVRSKPAPSYLVEIPDEWDVTWVDGEVRFPEGMPLDEELWVQAKVPMFDEDELKRRFVRARVLPDGRFRLPISRLTLSLRISVLGRYCYLSEPKRWKRKEPEPLVLEPKLGFLLEVQCIAPADWQWKLQDLMASVESELEDREKQTVEVDASGYAEFRALPARKPDEGFYFEPDDGPEVETHIAELTTSGQDIGDATVTLTGRGIQTCEAKIFNALPGERRKITITPELGGTLEGTLIESNGRPFDNALVSVTLKEGSNDAQVFGGAAEPYVSRTIGTTVRNNRFTLHGLPPNALELQVRAKGYSRETIAISPVAPGEVRTITITPNPSPSLSGRLRWPSGEPAANARVQVLYNSFGRSSRARTNSEGRFEVLDISTNHPEILVLSTVLGKDIPARYLPPDGESRPKLLRTSHGFALAGGEPLELTIDPAPCFLEVQAVHSNHQTPERFSVTARMLLPDFSGASQVSQSETARQKRESVLLQGLFPEPGPWK